MSLRTCLRLLAVPAIVISATFSSLASADELRVGKSVPELKVKWVQGQVDGLSDPSKTYVVEFWATWCAPCARSIPHLTQLYTQHRGKGLVIMGLSRESDIDVLRFVKKRGSLMAYPVGCIEGDSYGEWAWSQDAAIPHAFVIREGKVLWAGSPLDKQFDTVVLSVLRGRYNPTLLKQAEPALEAARAAVRVENFNDAYKHFDAVIELDGRIFGDVAVRKYRTMILDQKNSAGAVAWGEQMLQKYSDDPVTLTELAEFILKDDALVDRDLKLARVAAERADFLAPSANSKALVALVHFRGDDIPSAVEVQYEAWMRAEPNEKADYKKVLDTYKKAQATSAAKSGS